MGKIILEFNSEEESDDARTALDGAKWKAAMWELDQKLRSTTKYGQSVINTESNASEIEQDIAGIYREIITEITQSHGIFIN